MIQVIGGAAAAAAGAAVAAGAGVGKSIRSMAGSKGAGQAAFRVEPDRVFDLARRFDDIAEEIALASDRAAGQLIARAPGADKPSRDAADRLIETAFGQSGLVTRTRAYAEELRTAARALRDAATQYGLTDDTEGARFAAPEI